MHMVFILLQPVPSKLGTGVFKSPTQLSLQFMHIQMKCQKLYNQTKFTDSSSLVSAAFCICQGRSCSARRMRRQWKPFLAMKGYGTFKHAWCQFSPINITAVCCFLLSYAYILCNSINLKFQCMLKPVSPSF